MLLKKRINFLIGQYLDKKGYYIGRLHRKKASTLNLLELALFVLNRRGPLHIIQVGSYDGFHADPLHKFLQDRSDRVFFIEPQANPLQNLRSRYPDKESYCFLNYAITEHDGTHLMYLDKEKEHSPKASLKETHLREFGQSRSDIRTIEVEGLSVATLVSRYQLSQIDLLQIDAEGADWEILQQFWDAKIDPEIINLESFHLSASCKAEFRAELTRRGYEYIDHDLDTLAMKADLFSLS